MSALLVVVTAYLLGSIPFGYLIVKATRGRDVRESGSGGTGATNVSRSAGKLAGVLTLVLDALKGTAAVLIARFALAGETSPEWWIAASAVAVLLGQIFPVWLQFRGGKGVATGLGVFVVMFPFEVAIALVLFLVVVLSTRYVSLASMSAAVAIPAAATAKHLLLREGSPLGPLVFASIAGAILIITAHRQNIQRLIDGKEPRFR